MSILGTTGLFTQDDEPDQVMQPKIHFTKHSLSRYSINMHFSFIFT
jgi:hypothetical protein